MRCLYICNIAAFILNWHKNYKKATALIVTLVTMLLVMPLQLLHSHNTATKQLPASKTSITAQCAVCDFEYSPADADAVSYTISAKPNYYTFRISLYEHADDTYANTFSNKSPPLFS